MWTLKTTDIFNLETETRACIQNSKNEAKAFGATWLVIVYVTTYEFVPYNTI